MDTNAVTEYTPGRRGLKPGQRHSGQFKPGFDARRNAALRFEGRTIAELAREACPEAIVLLRKAMELEEVPWPSRIQAANSLLDRGFGRPVSVVEMNVTTDRPVEVLTDAELQLIIEGECSTVLDAVQPDSGDVTP